MESSFILFFSDGYLVLVSFKKKDFLLPIALLGHLCKKSVGSVNVGLSVSGLSIWLHWSVCIFRPISHCLDFCSFIVIPEITKW